MDEALTGEFFEWLEGAEESNEVAIMFENLENGVLTLTVENFMVKFNIRIGQIHSNAGVPPELSEACDLASSSLSANVSLSQMLDTFLEKYQELKEFGDMDEDSGSDQDYTHQIMEIENEELLRRAQESGESTATHYNSAAFQHFVFQEAAESIRLLEETIKRCPDLAHCCSITNNAPIYNIRIELNLAFMDILDSFMTMLDLDYAPLIISISMDENFTLQSMNETCWTPGLIGGLSVCVYQKDKPDSYGCSHYVLGRVQKFKEDVYNILKQNANLPNVLALSRESSLEQDANSDYTNAAVYMGFSNYQAQEALKIANGDPNFAMDILRNGTCSAYKGQYKDAVIPCNNFFYNLLFYLHDRLQNCTNYCFICYKKHMTDSIRLRPCGKDICEFRFEEVSGISLYAELKSNANMILLDLSFAAEALSSGRNYTVFEPFPSFLLKKQQMRGKSGFLERGPNVTYTSKMDDNKDIALLRELYSKLPSPMQLRSRCSDETSLKDLLASVCGESFLLCYKLYKYIVATNRLALVKLEGKGRIPNVPDSVDQYIVSNHAPETLRYFNQQKKVHGSLFAFHGSALENWYSILRNGIRNLSHTHMMTAGAASGAGVYTAEHCSTSLGYARIGQNGESIWPYSILNNCGCLAIVEIIKNQPEYKNGNVYVVRNDRDLIIRYLLIFNATDYSTNLTANSLKLEQHIAWFEKSFKEKQRQIREKKIKKAMGGVQRVQEETKDPIDEKIQKLAEVFSGQGSAMTNKRIMQEYKYILKSSECKGLTVDFEGSSNMYVWDVRLNVDQFHLSKLLQKDFSEYASRYNKGKELVFEVRFDSNFPYNPPFVRVVRPRFQFRTGHITIGGSICMESLTPSGWIPVRTIESLFIEILYNVSEGDARLDLRAGNVEYTLAEAQEAFDRVARQHGWIH